MLHNLFVGGLIHILEQWPERASEENAETIQAMVRNQLPSDPVPGWGKIVFGEMSEMDHTTLLAQLKANYPSYYPVIVSKDDEQSPEYASIGAYQDWKRTGGSEH